MISTRARAWTMEGRMDGHTLLYRCVIASKELPVITEAVYFISLPLDPLHFIDHYILCMVFVPLILLLVAAHHFLKCCVQDGFVLGNKIFQWAKKWAMSNERKKKNTKQARPKRQASFLDILIVMVRLIGFVLFLDASSHLYMRVCS